MATLYGLLKHGTSAYLMSPDGSSRYGCQILAIHDEIAYVKFDMSPKVVSVYLKHLIPNSNPRAGRARVDTVLSWLRKGNVSS